MIDNVNQWLHLSHNIDNCRNDGADILFRRNAMVGEIYNVLCYFSQVVDVPKLKLLKPYCSRVNDCELWNLFHAASSDVCTMHSMRYRFTESMVAALYYAHSSFGTVV